MNSSAVRGGEALATDAKVNDESLSVRLADGRTIAVPLAWFPRLVHATAAERSSWRLSGAGLGIHWQALDEDISIENLLAGQPPRESQSSFAKWLAGRAKPSAGAKGQKKGRSPIGRNEPSRGRSIAKHIVTDKFGEARARCSAGSGRASLRKE